LGCRCARRVDHHAGIVACRRCGTRAAWGSAGILRTKGVIGERFLIAGVVGACCCVLIRAVRRRKRLCW
jgi:hypothetical protein